MKFVLNRDLVLASRLGATVRFEKNKPTFAPDFLQAEIEALGGEVVEGGEAAQTEQQGPVEPQGPARIEAMNDAFAKSALAGKTDKAPSVKDMHEAMGWTPTAAERDLAWAEFVKGK